MRLTLLLLRKRMPHGNIHRGKDRLWPNITPLIKAQARHELAVEEQNMFYLRHPYLSYEQSQGHEEALEKKAVQAQRAEEDKYHNRMLEHVSLKDRLQHLKVSEGWDPCG